MEILKNFTIKQWIIASTAILVIFGTIIVYYFKNIQSEYSDNYEYLEEIESYNQEANTKNEEDTTENIIIHITGCIKKQGIVILNQGERIVDAIEKAGGTTDEADLNKINLAYELQDGEKLYIPSINDDNNDEYVSEGEKKYVSSSYNSSNSENNIVNINKATAAELQSLNGIGESMASKIIKYREENGKFQSIEDIKNVPGIGDAKFNNIKEFITVN